MTRVYINQEGFELIERRQSVSPEAFAKKFGIKVNSARSWLSKWTKKGYLKFNPPSPDLTHYGPGRPGGGTYSIGDREWNELYYDNET